ncbi:hypothetical protein NE237_001112 [Protea cynaroides]|uniref:Pectin acetylesterase n=1 Tax=Protea cynaroides TaxID=273540 RepID=A0A9Q0KTD1_9MAGN|nr:hypothetical protein NE237_001112 [Protea cynaroides]
MFETRPPFVCVCYVIVLCLLTNSTLVDKLPNEGITVCVIVGGYFKEAHKTVFSFGVHLYSQADGFYVGMTYVENAVVKREVCLDGSPPAYHFDKGFCVGINN